MCRHGLQGEKCKYLHPKPCATFMKHGLDENLGCTPGWKCSDYHPLVCRSSLHTRECKRRECKYPHIKGTKRPNNQYSRSTQQRNQREDRGQRSPHTHRNAPPPEHHRQDTQRPNGPPPQVWNNASGPTTHINRNNPTIGVQQNVDQGNFLEHMVEKLLDMEKHSQSTINRLVERIDRLETRQRGGCSLQH
ncbi:hypothetical protein GWK47_028013 [Chionoecetes opilio]|uniref:Uncharacterized protein n=1 Tax=Chionoecetes opilio TaxID=41210 RepID=A0A8J4YLN8_CHIOP|nr:hypothetical protein GWK47_028013 [Chionoecetes opilio]